MEETVGVNQDGAINEAAIQERRMNPGRMLMLAWRNSGHICALSDGERHVGHILRIGGRWHAFDAMHSNEAGDGFRSLGTFATVGSAKEAVEQSYRLWPVRYAGAA
jgi:hypothetical protein